MVIKDRIEAFRNLGISLQRLTESELNTLAEKVILENNWFTFESISLAINGIVHLLDPTKINIWLENYLPFPNKNKTVGVIMAGNIPMVGFHDAMCVLLCGYSLIAKPSHQDSILMKFVLDKIAEIEPRFAPFISIQNRLEGINGLIATGSDNTARYFEYYFRTIPRIIRKNRTSIAIINGRETDEDIVSLGFDVFSYFGLGCRNISMIYIPKEYDLKYLIKRWQKFSYVLGHSKYQNNYKYQKAVSQISNRPFIDGVFFLFSKNDKLGSPLSVIYFMEYENIKALQSEIEKNREKIQIIVSNKGWFENSLEFGKSQQPNIDDYADKVDTLKFLIQL